VSRLVVAGLQHACFPDRDETMAGAFELAREARARGAELICFQELFASLYFPQRPRVEAHRALAEPVPGPTTGRLGALARELRATLVGSLYERATDGSLYDTAVVVLPDGRLAGRSRKMHIPDGSGYFERSYFRPGDGDYPVFDVPASDGTWPIGVPTCWDQWFPEVARIHALHGAHALLYPSAIGNELEPDLADADTREAWRTVMRGHAVANGLYVIAVNRVGREDRLTFYGGSFVAAPTGEVIAELDDAPGILLAELDGREVAFARRLSPLLAGRRPETYEALTRRER
jgi:N-carbamoylputrescine amidase